MFSGISRDFYDGNRYRRLYSPSCNRLWYKRIRLRTLRICSMRKMRLYDIERDTERGVSGRGCSRLSELTEVLSESSEDWMPFCEIAMDLTGRSGCQDRQCRHSAGYRGSWEYIRLRTEEGEDIPWPGEEEAVIRCKACAKMRDPRWGYRYTADRGWRKAKSEGGRSVSKLYL